MCQTSWFFVDLPPAPRLIANKKSQPKKSKVHQRGSPVEEENEEFSELGISVSSTNILGSEKLETLATHCNERKYSAKLCSVHLVTIQAVSTY